MAQKKSQKTVNRKKSHYGQGKELIPLKQYDLKGHKTASSILKGMALTSFTGRTIGEAADVLETMVKDENCFRVLTLSGAMTVAQMGMLIYEMLAAGWFDVVVSTGALITHGLVQSIGRTHFKTPKNFDDRRLYAQAYNRVYDTIELETNLDDVEEMFNDHILKNLVGQENLTLCSYKICDLIGEHLKQTLPKRDKAILKIAHEKKIPIFIPAFTDSELGLDMGIYRYAQKLKGQKQINFNPFLDLDLYANLIQTAVKMDKKLGIFTIGGGVPRNWAQQVGPFLDIRAVRLGEKHGALARFTYGVRICDAPVTNGGLSGCTYREGVSWGKFVPEEEGGRQAEVVADATAILPLLITGVMERMKK